ncbi:MAG: hypothetical protein AAFQ98_08475 [Bacteroidota bacterium]
MTTPFEVSQWPIVRIKISNTITVEDISQMFAQMEQLFLTQEGPCVSVTSFPNGFLSSEVRVALGKEGNDILGKYSDRILGSIIIVPNAIARMMLKGALLLVKIPFDVKMANNEEEAVKLAKDLLPQTIVKGNAA